MTSPLSEDNVATIIDALASHAQTTGLYERVNQYEPKSNPGTGITGAVWLQELRPAIHSSGLSDTSMVLIAQFRSYTTMTMRDPERIDPKLTSAVVQLFSNYNNDFSLDGLIRNIDLLGIEGEPLSAKAGYLNIDSSIYRIYDTVIPMIVDDVFTQAP